MKKITITVNERDIKTICDQAYDYVWHGDWINEKKLYEPIERIRKAIAFSKINHSKVLDNALTGTREEVQEKALKGR